MPNFEIPRHIAAIGYDLDDSLLNNKPGFGPGHHLHERSQRASFQGIGAKYDIEWLKNISDEESLQAFLDAPFHTHEAAIRYLFTIRNLIGTRKDLDYETLVRETVNLKETLHEEILWREGEANPGAIDFARRATDHFDIYEQTGIGTNATRSNVDIFIRKEKVQDLFVDPRIIAIEQIKKPKPHPETYRRLFDTFDLPEEEREFTVVVEDDPKGIESTVRNHMFSVAITTRFRYDYLAALPTPPNLIVSSFEELGEALHLPKIL